MSTTFQNLDQEETWGVGMTLPKGAHIVDIDDIEEGKSSGNHDEWRLTLVCPVGEYKGFSIRDWQVITPQSYGKVKQILEAAGIEIQGGDWEFDPAMLKGKRVAILVREAVKEQGENAGSTYLEVAGYMEATRLGASGGSNGATASAPAGGDPFAPKPAQDDDDIPF